jgi:hypothetical protein
MRELTEMILSKKIGSKEIRLYKYKDMHGTEIIKTSKVALVAGHDLFAVLRVYHIGWRPSFHGLT